MATLGAKRRVFESVFSSQISSTHIPLMNGSDQVDDQIQWDRSWRTVTQALKLPSIPNNPDAFKSIKAVPSPDRSFDEAVKNLRNQPTRLPQASHTQDIVLWYTNHVRRHYLNQVFPIIRDLRATRTSKPGTASTSDAGTWVGQCVHILEGAYRLYYEGLALLLRVAHDARAVHREFYLNLSTVVSNSIPDRSDFQETVRRHVSKILAPKSSVPEDEFLSLVRSLSDVGLGGEKFQILFAEIMNDAMKVHVCHGCGRVWEAAIPREVAWSLPQTAKHAYTSGATTDLCEWIENRYARLAVQVLDILDKPNDVSVSWSQVEKWKEMSIGHLAMLRTDELFDIVTQWPNASGGLNDLLIGITTPQRRLRLSDVFTSHLNDRLLHPGASTLQILRTYISIIRSFHILDQSSVLLRRVALPLQLYLCTREDTVRTIIAGLLSEIVDSQGEPVEPGGDRLVELALLLNESGSGIARADDDDLDWHDMRWVPDPVDAGPGYKRSKNADIIGTLIRVLGSQDVFIKEFQNIIGENLLRQNEGFEKEIKVLELLKARFGESPLQSCEVMLKDIQDSGRTNIAIRENPQLNSGSITEASPDATPEGPTLQAKILSRLFWPQLHDEDYRIPDDIAKLQKRYEQGFESLKASRKLTWLPALGQATVELELTDRTIVEEVHTWQATVIWAFESEEPGSVTRSVEQLVERLEMDETLVRSALKFWTNKLVLQEGSKDVYSVLETLNQEERARSTAQAAAGQSKSQDESLAPNEGITQEKMQMYWQFIQAMLTNTSRQMPLQQIAMMLKMLIADGFPYSNEELQEFLGWKVQMGELEVVGGKYKLKK